MTAAMTYDSLISDITLYCERTDSDFLSQLPRFVMMAENRLASEVRGLGLQQYVTGTMTSSVFPKPERWRETISLNISTTAGRVFLYPRTYDYCRAFAPISTVTGEPRYYADYQYENYLVVPTPDMAYAFEIDYYARPVPLSDSNQTNWTTQYAPQLIMYASLLEAQPFLKRPELLAQWTALYDRALQGITQESSRRTNSDRAATTRAGE